MAALSELDTEAASPPDVGYMPVAYLNGFLQFLHRHRDVVELLTYERFHWASDDYDPATMYKAEHAAWRAWLAGAPERQRKIYLNLQLDVDGYPECTNRLLERMRALGIRCNVMIFNKHVSRRLLSSTNEIVPEEYPIDYALLQQNSPDPFVVGYHTNAVERGRYEMPRALELFEEDVVELRQSFPHLRFFSPHGGVPGPDRLNNNGIDIGEELQRRLNVRWVHNRRYPAHAANYTDGAINSGRRPQEDYQFETFVRKWRPGRRYQMLIHPHHYGDARRPGSVFSGSPWYENLWRTLIEGKRSVAQRARQRLSGVECPVWGRFVYVRPMGRFLWI